MPGILLDQRDIATQKSKKGLSLWSLYSREGATSEQTDKCPLAGSDSCGKDKAA